MRQPANQYGYNDAKEYYLCVNKESIKQTTKNICSISNAFAITNITYDIIFFFSASNGCKYSKNESSNIRCMSKFRFNSEYNERKRVYVRMTLADYKFGGAFRWHW